MGADDPPGVTSVLVAYASKRGSTAEIAEAIAEALRQSGVSVDCIEAGKVGSVEPYDAVVLGSAVYIKRWRGDAFASTTRSFPSDRSGCSAPARSETPAATPTRRGLSHQR